MKRIIVIALASAFLSVGCTSSDTLSGNVYSANQAKQVQSVTYGTILSVRQVKIQSNTNSDGSTSNIFGTLGGAVLGGILGHSIGGGSGKDLATAAGVIVGSVAGGSVENNVSKVNALELEVRQDNGSTFIVVQKARTNEFYAGQKVKIINGQGKISIAPN